MLLTMFIFCKWTTLGQKVRSFYEATELRSMLTDEHVLETIDLSVINMLCGRLCSRDSNCVSFFENSVSHQCRLVDIKLNISQMSLTGVQGWQYYISQMRLTGVQGWHYNGKITKHLNIYFIKTLYGTMKMIFDSLCIIALEKNVSYMGMAAMLVMLPDFLNTISYLRGPDKSVK